jgi:hypothetical protein
MQRGSEHSQTSKHAATTTAKPKQQHSHLQYHAEQRYLRTALSAPAAAAPSHTPHHPYTVAEIFDGSAPQQLVSALQGRRLLAAGRKGKNLWLTLEGQGPMPLMHFGKEPTTVKPLTWSTSSSSACSCLTHMHWPVQGRGNKPRCGRGLGELRWL